MRIVNDLLKLLEDFSEFLEDKLWGLFTANTEELFVSVDISREIPLLPDDAPTAYTGTRGKPQWTRRQFGGDHEISGGKRCNKRRQVEREKDVSKSSTYTKGDSG
jgi:hypothetical protein